MTDTTRMNRCISSATMLVAVSLLLLSSISRTVHADDAAPTLCSCSPTVFTFTLSLSQTCDNNDIQENSGIDGSFCFTEEGVAVPDAPESGDESDGSEDSSATSADARASAAIDAADAIDGPVRNLLFRPLGRSLQIADPVVEILSVQFLEFDTSGDLTVINQDDTYADVSLSDGDVIEFASASSFLDTDIPLADQASSPALVPGGASLILYGRTEGGNVIRNRFFWMYDMNCGRRNNPVRMEDEIGWVTVLEISNAWPVFCPALPEGSPTLAPKTREPSLVPTASPIESPTDSPTEAPITSAPTTGRPSHSPHDGGHGPAFKGKSHKSKTLKYKSKTSKSKSSKHSKATKYAKSSEDGQDYYHHKSSKTGKTSKSAKYQKLIEKVSRFDVQRVSGADSCGSGIALATALVASYLFAR